MGILDDLPPQDAKEYTGPELDVNLGQNQGTVIYASTEKKTVEEVLQSAGIDGAKWRVASAKHTHRTGWSKLGPAAGDRVVLVTVWLTSVTVTPRSLAEVGAASGVEGLLQALREAPKPLPAVPPLMGGGDKELEVCLMDPHFGMQCYGRQEASDHPWSMDMAEETITWAVESLLERAASYGPFSRIVLPFGNDWMHADNFPGTTTAGTPQNEAVSYQEAYRRGLYLMVRVIERLAEVAPVKAYKIPGNHDRQSVHTLGLSLECRFHGVPYVEIDASDSPYKFHRFGVNLIGYEHGHSVKGNRLPLLMANERPKDWAETKYREWHVGDQHRKASGKPSHFEEGGVSVEYLAALTPANEWHRLKGYNWQQRGATAFVWHREQGPIARLSCALDPYTGRPLGASDAR